MKKHILPSLLVLASWFFYSSCSVKEPELIAIENVRVEKFGLRQSALDLELHYFNPNNTRLKLKRAEGTAWLDGNPLGQFVLDTLIRIPARADFRLPLRLQVDMKYFVENMAKAMSGKEVVVKIDGTARVGKSILTINYPIQYEGKHKLSELLK